MPISDYDALKSAIEAAPMWSFSKIQGGAVFLNNGTWADTWNMAPDAGTPPSTAVAPTSATTGSRNPSYAGISDDVTGSYTRRMAIFNANIIQALSASAANGSCMIIDRLSQAGGLSGTVTGVQTTNLPTAALTRFTTGEGVRAAVSISSQIGSTATTATCEYVNQAGATKTSHPFVIGGSGRREQNAMIQIPMADGDTGVRAVNNINLVGTTGTAGAMHIVLYKPLAIVPNQISAGLGGFKAGDLLLGGGGQLTQWSEGACVGILMANPVSLNFNNAINIKLIKDDV